MQYTFPSPVSYRISYHLIIELKKINTIHTLYRISEKKKIKIKTHRRRRGNSGALFKRDVTTVNYI